MEFLVFQKAQNYAKDTAPHRGTRTVVKQVLLAGLAVTVGQNAIQLTTDEPWREVKRCARLGMRPRAISRYIPVKMPPQDGTGCVFKLPTSDSWRLAHRTVKLACGR